MSLCPHGYTENFDCPECDCPCGSGLPAGDCSCPTEAEERKLDDPRRGQADWINGQR